MADIAVPVPDLLLAEPHRERREGERRRTWTSARGLRGGPRAALLTFARTSSPRHLGPARPAHAHQQEHLHTMSGTSTPELRQPQSQRVSDRIAQLSPDQPFYTFEVRRRHLAPRSSCRELLCRSCAPRAVVADTLLRSPPPPPRLAPARRSSRPRRTSASPTSSTASTACRRSTRPGCTSRGARAARPRRGRSSWPARARAWVSRRACT